MPNTGWRAAKCMKHQKQTRTVNFFSVGNGYGPTVMADLYTNSIRNPAIKEFLDPWQTHRASNRIHDCPENASNIDVSLPPRHQIDAYDRYLLSNPRGTSSSCTDVTENQRTIVRDRGRFNKEAIGRSKRGGQ